jgi:hypothetical protein
VFVHSHGDGLSWRGAAWAKSYEVWCQGTLVDGDVVDDVKAGDFKWRPPQGWAGQGREWRVRGKGVDGHLGEWSDGVVW